MRSAEGDGAEEGGQAFVDVFELGWGDFLGAAGFGAEGVDDEVETEAGVALHAGEDFVAGFCADFAAVVVAVVEGGAVDLCVGQGFHAEGGGLGGALVGGGAGQDRVVEERAGEGGDGPGIEVEGGDPADIGFAARGGGVCTEVGKEAVFALEIPAGRDGEADLVLGIGEGAGGGGVRVFRFGGFCEAADGEVRELRGGGLGVIVEFGGLLRAERQGEESG